MMHPAIKLLASLQNLLCVKIRVWTIRKTKFATLARRFDLEQAMIKHMRQNAILLSRHVLQITERQLARLSIKQATLGNLSDAISSNHPIVTPVDFGRN